MVSFALTTMLSLMFTACGDGSTNKQKAESSEDDHSKREHATDSITKDAATMEVDHSQSATEWINRYLTIKSALVNDDAKGASTSKPILWGSI